MLRRLVVPALAVATLFPRLFAVPGLPAQVQLTELLFILALPFWYREIGAVISRYRVYGLVAGSYCLVNLVSGIISGSEAALLEACGRVYLVMLSLLVAAYLRESGDVLLRTWWARATVGLSLVAVLVYGLAIVTGNTLGTWIVLIPDYPYLGDVYRLRATAGSYGMFFMLLLPGWYWLATSPERWKNWWLTALGVVTLALAATLGKELLLLAVAVLLLRFRGRGWLPWAVGGLAVVLWLGTHFVLSRTGSELTKTAYVDGEYLRTKEYVLLGTNYLANKRAAIALGRQHPWLGVGPGRYIDYTPLLREQGHYPAHFGPFDPHSAWTGAFAETGTLGLSALLALVVFLWRMRSGPPGPVEDLLLLLLIASVFKDIMNFRALWILLGMYLWCYPPPVRSVPSTDDDI